LRGRRPRRLFFRTAVCSRWAPTSSHGHLSAWPCLLTCDLSNGPRELVGSDIVGRVRRAACRRVGYLSLSPRWPVRCSLPCRHVAGQPGSPGHGRHPCPDRRRRWDDQPSAALAFLLRRPGVTWSTAPAVRRGGRRRRRCGSPGCSSPWRWRWPRRWLRPIPDGLGSGSPEQRAFSHVRTAATICNLFRTT